MGLRLGVFILGGCGGCEMVLIDVLGRREDLLHRYDIAYWKLVHGSEEVPELDIAMVTGAVVHEEDIEFVKEVRAKSRILVALGTCASLGGIPSQADYWVKARALKEIYGEVPRDVPRLTRTRPVSEIVDVDFAIPRCPPPAEAVERILEAFARGEKPEVRVYESICSQCSRKMEEIKIERIEDLEKFFKRGLPRPGEVDPKKCLLSQGYLCLGPVTAAGCGAICPRLGIPCFGCGGPIHDIVESIDMDIPINLSRVIATLAGLDPAKEGDRVLKILEKVYGFRRFYVFTLTSPIFISKPRALALRVLAEQRLRR